MESDGARLTAMESLCTSRPRNRLGPLGAAGPSKRAAAVSGAAVLGRGDRIVFCGSTGGDGRSMYVFMVFAFLWSVVWGVSPTTCGSAPFTRCNPRLIRRADTQFAFIPSHTVYAARRTLYENITRSRFGIYSYRLQ